jgi:hypothetical protein
MLIVVHIPKTGGNTFKTVLVNAFGSGYLEDYETSVTTKPYWQDFLNGYRYRFSKNQPPPATHCIQGHFLAIKYTHIPQARFVTWVRDPIQLAHSLYYYWQRMPKLAHPLCRKMHQKNMSLAEFAALSRFWNLQTKFLFGVRIESLAFIGITEEYDKSMRLFNRIFDLPDETSYTAQNYNPSRSGDYKPDSSLESKLRQWHSRDLTLYDRCRKQFDKLCRDHGVK